ncbi:MAG: hypothetical protein AVDCRST_MAG77-4276 [uncultured Chloroflexi bacterium]|uniref:Response regulatory domain-containing protein n=1 Tax=uncultured Chloroflexota bacterium TaxID=166587 RepID=A0A6J4JJK4_9CHLR|nr:MAG: hypothetical protein AVDCRST_MAG77-4276 [uncultured Chloroflexota bacterium]
MNGQAAPSRPAPLRVLIVDDDPQVRQITEALVRAEGHTVTAASDGVEALAAFETGTFDLVVTDRAMPRMGGDQLAVAIKGRSPTTSIILLTGFGDLMDAGEKPPGVDAVLGKQATISRLRDAVTRVVPVPAAVT